MNTRMRQAIRLAFKDLRKEGVVARMNFMCCTTCASDALSKSGKPVVYFTQRDHRDLLKYELVDIRYETPEDTNDATRALGEKVEKSLQKHGLRVVWDGNPAKTLSVKGMALTAAMV